MRQWIAIGSAVTIGAIALACAQPAQNAGFTTMPATSAPQRANAPSSGAAALDAGPSYACSAYIDQRERGCIIERHNDFDNATLVMGMFSGESDGLTFTATGAPDREPDRVLLEATAMHSTWQWFECFQLAFLIDGERVQVPTASRVGRVIDNGVSEGGEIVVTLPLLERMAAAHSVRGRVCTNEFTMTDAQLGTLRHLVDRWHEIAASRAANGDASVTTDDAAIPDAGARE